MAANIAHGNANRAVGQREVVEVVSPRLLGWVGSTAEFETWTGWACSEREELLPGPAGRCGT